MTIAVCFVCCECALSFLLVPLLLLFAAVTVGATAPASWLMEYLNVLLLN